LGHRFDDVRSAGLPAGLTVGRTIQCGTLVVGGGVAGMAAALAAAEAGDRVVLVERCPWLGGDARVFGPVGDEEPPDVAVERLSKAIDAAPEIEVLLRAEAHSLAEGRVRVHHVTLEDGRIHGRLLAIEAKRIVLATGAAERLPIVPGNRLPGVIGAVDAYHCAARFGLWRGKRALVATPNNYGYRLALLAADCGIEIQRVVDSRIAPQSRFIDFCKASGITLASGLVPRSVTADHRGRQLSVGFAVAVEEAGQEAGAVATETLVVAGSWQPRLDLWLMAGGRSTYDYSRRWLAPSGELEGVAIIGAAAGWRSLTACLASAVAAIGYTRGKVARPIEEYEVDAVYESPEAPPPVAPWRPGRGAYLDRGVSFTTRPVPRRDETPDVSPTDLGLLSLGDVASFVQLGAIPDRDAGIIAQERCIAIEEIADTGWQVSAEPAPVASEVPAYLVGRYGPKPVLAVVVTADGRRLEAGCLVYLTSDATDLGAAIGSILGPAPDGRPGAVMLARRADLTDAISLFVRDTSGAVPLTISERF
jgi:sarcosine oxidase subunit alpha